jgi:hypothetical protein
MNPSSCSGLLTICSLLALTPALLLAQPALARHADLYVDAAAKENGDGSREHPFWRITDGVVAARTLRRQHHRQRITLHVLPGTYVGSYDVGHLENDPRLEVLPIILNVSNLSLEGRTEFDEDADGLPTGNYPLESETLLTIEVCDPHCLMRGRGLLVIGRTTDGMAGNRVSVSGFVMDGQVPGTATEGGFDIYADRVSDFSIHHNLLRHADQATQTRLASGTLEANFINANTNVGIWITGGSMVHRASVAARRNRSTQSVKGASLFALANFAQLQVGANPLMLEALQTIYDIDNPEDQQNIPNRLEANIEGNDISHNSNFGLAPGGLYPTSSYNTADATQPITGSLNVTVRDNRLNRNGNYGIISNAGNVSRSNPRQFTGIFELTFERNALIGNGRNTSEFGFVNGMASAGEVSRENFKYMQESTIQVTDLDGELAGFDYDHLLNDPFDDSPVVGNVLLYNGEVQPNGIRIAPRH